MSNNSLTILGEQKEKGQSILSSSWNLNLSQNFVGLICDVRARIVRKLLIMRQIVH